MKIIIITADNYICTHNYMYVYLQDYSVFGKAADFLKLILAATYRHIYYSQLLCGYVSC